MFMASCVCLFFYTRGDGRTDGRVSSIRVFAEIGWVGILVLCFLYEIIPNPWEKVRTCCGKKPGPNATFTLFSWVGEFVGFIMIFMRFPTKHDLVNR